MENHETSNLYQGDLQKTQILADLFETPADHRDEEWKNTFLKNVAAASFSCGDPQVIQGPDGFPYFQLRIPEPNKPFTCYVIDYLKEDYLLKQGIGAAIFKQNSNRPEWVFSYGDLLNHQLTNEFYSAIQRTTTPETEVLQQNEQVLTAQPSEQFLPQATRAVLRSVMEQNSITGTKLMLLTRIKSGVPSSELVFNLTPDRLQSQGQFEGIMRTISWFLPRHYSFCAMKEANFETSFEAL